jgi:hypothetical protein
VRQRLEPADVWLSVTPSVEAWAEGCCDPLCCELDGCAPAVALLPQPTSTTVTALNASVYPRLRPAYLRSLDLAKILILALLSNLPI